MLELLGQPTVQAGLALAVVLVLAYVGFQVVMRLRPTTCKPDNGVEAIAQNFEEMRLGGDIDEAELRRIRAVLGKTDDLGAGGQEVRR